MGLGKRYIRVEGKRVRYWHGDDFDVINKKRVQRFVLLTPGQARKEARRLIGLANQHRKYADQMESWLAQQNAKKGK